MAPALPGTAPPTARSSTPTRCTCASPWLPFNTQLRVTNLATGLSVQVRVNDRGPFGRGVLDLSAHAAQIVQLSGMAAGADPDPSARAAVRP